MNKKSYLKHCDVMDWFYNQLPGNEKQVWKYCLGDWVLTDKPFWEENVVYIINDEFSEFRKAAHEGKTILVAANNIPTQELRNSDYKEIDISSEEVDINSYMFHYKSDRYKIKPDYEIDYIEGDYFKHANNILQIEEIDNNNKVKSGDSWYCISDIQKWIPEKGKLYAFSNYENRGYLIDTFVEISEYCSEHHYKTSSGEYYKYIKPININYIKNYLKDQADSFSTRVAYDNGIIKSFEKAILIDDLFYIIDNIEVGK